MIMQFMVGILWKKKDNEFMEKLLEVLQSEESGGDGLPIRVKLNMKTKISQKIS